MILITGSTGLLGGHLLALLLKHNEKIIATKRKNSNTNITKNILAYYFENVG
ncbi:MAG: hypothetical protein KatS3mg027_2101 [Bacteroidia bacterium]|nr:MAG: hypothetical protein KatS3mg027_2101 [Bacteroidia bacterium]